MTIESSPVHDTSLALLIPFQISPTGGVATVSGEAAILRQQMIGLLMTNHYERVMIPAFGADVQAKLFDPMDELASSDSAAEIKASLASISTLLNIQNVRFYQDPQELSGVILEVQYSIANQSSLLKVRFVDGILTEEDQVV